MSLTQAYLKSILHYDPDTGIFTYRADRGRTAKAGGVAGSISPAGYRRIASGHDKYMAHRLAFLYMTGGFPPGQVDHINGMRDDNRWCNLRSATNQDNSRNRSRFSSNISGVTGVGWHKRDRIWQAFIRVDNKLLHLGCHSDYFEAVCARKSAELSHGFHENHGRT